MSDTEVVEKVKKAGTGGVLIGLGTILAGSGIVWLFSTVHTNSTNSAVLVETMPHVVEELKLMRQGNDAGHLAIFGKLNEIDINLVTFDNRIDSLEKDCVQQHGDIEKCKEFLYKNGGHNGKSSF